MLSNRIQKIQPSATLAINAKAIELQKSGVDILKFGTGEPDFDTPEHIKEAAKRALNEGFTKYTAATGMPELKEAVAEKFAKENGIEADPASVMISVGGKQVLFNIFMAILNPGDEVIIPSPYWVSYSDMVSVCGGECCFVDTTPNHMKLTAEMVEGAITPKTKALILNSPSNPTGMVIEESEIRLIAELAKKHRFYVISDEVYEHFLYDGKQHFSIASLPGMRDLVFTVNAVSKTYSMTGWRIGYVSGPVEIIKAMGNLQSHSTSNPCSIAQKAALEALTGDQSSVRQMAEEFRKRRDFVYEAMNQIPGFKLVKPEGAFYAFPNVSGLYEGSIKNSFDLASFLLEKAEIAIVPGGAFGTEGDDYIRFSYASSMEDIERGLKKLKKCLT
jgi:aspartate aminotransferase